MNLFNLQSFSKYIIGKKITIQYNHIPATFILKSKDHHKNHYHSHTHNLSPSRLKQRQHIHTHTSLLRHSNVVHDSHNFRYLLQPRDNVSVCLKFISLRQHTVMKGSELHLAVTHVQAVVLRNLVADTC